LTFPRVCALSRSPAAAQTFTLAGRVMIDPLSLSDYDAVVARKGPVDIEVKVA